MARLKILKNQMTFVVYEEVEDRNLMRYRRIEEGGRITVWFRGQCVFDSVYNDVPVISGESSPLKEAIASSEKAV